jgi:hypothetical protein
VRLNQDIDPAQIVCSLTSREGRRSAAGLADCGFDSLTADRGMVRTLAPLSTRQWGTSQQLIEQADRRMARTVERSVGRELGSSCLVVALVLPVGRPIRRFNGLRRTSTKFECVVTGGRSGAHRATIPAPNLQGPRAAPQQRAHGYAASRELNPHARPNRSGTRIPCARVCSCRDLPLGST